jgi:hypothetical protein
METSAICSIVNFIFILITLLFLHIRYHCVQSRCLRLEKGKK